MTYIGQEDFLVNTEFREGCQHCQKGTPQFLKETLWLRHELTDTPLLIWMDSGNDAIDELGNLKGIFTDGDLRRLCNRVPERMGRIIIDDIMTTTPITLHKNQLVADVIEEIRLYNRTVSFYPVVENGVLAGSLRLVDISKSGLL